MDNNKKTATEAIKESFDELIQSTKAFVNAPKALWGVNLPYILEGLVYFGILTILGKYCSENIGMSDTYAGYVYSAVTGGITLSMLFLGGYSDKIGIRQSLALSLLFMLIGRIIVSVSGSFDFGSGLNSPSFFIMSAGLAVMVLAYGLYQPAAYAGIKKYSSKKNSAIAYAALYGFMNLGAFASGYISSSTRPLFEDVFPPNGLTAVFWVYVAITASALLISVLLLTKKSETDALEAVNLDNSESPEIEENDSKNEVDRKPNDKFTFIFLALAAISGAFLIYDASSAASVLNDVLRNVFWVTVAVMIIASGYFYIQERPYHPFRDARFSFFIFILIPVQTLFAHNWLTIPYYLDRAFIDDFVSRNFEVFSNLNPLLIFFLAPIVAGLTARASVYKMMIIGTFVMAIPTFLLSFGPNVYLFLLYILLMTIGEAMWQPRFLQWIAEIAPKGRTGLYMGVGQFPWFLTKILTGLYSGRVLEQYCPINTLPSEMNTEYMWTLYAFIAIISPVALVIARNWMVKGFKEK